MTHALTRKELEDLVGTITAEVMRQVKPASLVDVRPAAKPAAKDEMCEGCPHNPGPAVLDPRTIRLTADVRALAAVIDHTLLRPEATQNQIERLCDEAARMGFAAVCVNPFWVPVVAAKLRGSRVRVATVAGFPFGCTSAAAKRAEAEAAVVAGAQEVDMVMNIGAMKSGDTARVESDIRGVVEVCHARGAAVKVIIENGYLTGEEKVLASKLVKGAGAEFVKTSTGFGPSGATEADVRLMRATVGPAMGVKAAGGIRNLGDALRMLQAGATRLGASSSLGILAEAAALMN
ncbi:MAG: deoxyribose-phosphate aldolase [Terriglobia bacterium]